MRRTSPFSDPAWAKASANMAKLAEGNPEGNARYEAALTDIQSTQQADRFARENRDYLTDAAAALRNGDSQGFVSSTVQTGENWGDIASVLQANGGARLAAGQINPDQMRAYNSGAGNIPDQDNAYTLAESNAISGRDAMESQRQAVAKQAMANRSTLEGAAVQDTPSALLQDPEIVRDLSMAINADSMDPENVLADSMYRGQTGMEQGMRINDPLSADETIASVMDDDMDGLAYRRWGNGPEADEADAALNADTGGDGQNPMDTLDQTRIRDLQEQLSTAASNYLIDRGAPMAENADGEMILDYSAASEALPQIVQMASDAQAADIDAGRPVAPASLYVSQAARTLGVSVDAGAESSLLNPFSWGDGRDPSISMNGGGSSGSGGGGRPVVRSDEDYDALPPGAKFQDENGETFTKPGA